MPRVDDQYLDCVIYLYRSHEDARVGERVGGSGFLVSLSHPSIPGTGGFVYAVTNRHVIEEGFPVVRINMHNGPPDVVPFSKASWVLSETDDLAIRIMPKMDTQKYKYRSAKYSDLLTKEKAEALDIGPGDDVFVVGRFINHEGIEKNAPTYRFGQIAQSPGDKVVYEICGKHHEQESYLMDIKSIGGYSGSPVWLNEPAYIQRPRAKEKIDKRWVIGVDWGHILYWQPLYGQNRKPIQGGGLVRVNTGIAGVVPAWKLIDLLERDDVKEFREQEVAAYKAAQVVASPDTDSTNIKATTDANPNHKEDFTALLGAAARKQK